MDSGGSEQYTLSVCTCQSKSNGGMVRPQAYREEVCVCGVEGQHLHFETMRTLSNTNTPSEEG